MEVRIERLGHLGDGVAEGPVFVPGALPGELVEGAVVGSRMERARILEPVPERVRPTCPHYKTCGGCALMHARDDFVAAWKADVLRASLAARGIAAPIRAIHTSPPATRRRAVLSGRRTKSGPRVGFHARSSTDIVAVPGCNVLAPALVEAIPAFEQVTMLGASRKGEIRLAVTLTEGGVDLDVSGGKPLDRDVLEAAVALAGRHDLARLSWDGEVIAEIRQPEISFGPARVVPPPGAFLQATPEGEAALLASAREATVGAARVLDLFAGCGTFSLPLAVGAEVHALEGDGAMIRALDAGWRRASGLRRVTTEARDLFRRPLLAGELSRFDAVVIDPPRAGAEAQMTALAEAGPGRIASLSCRPTSFARDAEILVGGGYRLDWVDVIDQFRWSTHLEIAARFSRA